MSPVTIQIRALRMNTEPLNALKGLVRAEVSAAAGSSHDLGRQTTCLLRRDQRHGLGNQTILVAAGSKPRPRQPDNISCGGIKATT
jgi:hypothetical protein